MKRRVVMLIEVWAGGDKPPAVSTRMGLFEHVPEAETKKIMRAYEVFDLLVDLLP